MRRCTEGAKRWAAGVAQSLQDEISFTFEDHCCAVWTVNGNLLAVEYPNAQKRHWLSTKLNQTYGAEYLVVNLSGETYDTTPFQGPVMDIVMSGSVVPLDVLVRLCVSAHKWLSCSSERRLVVHGEDKPMDRSPTNAKATGESAGPVVLLLACYLSWIKAVANPKEGLLQVCKELHIPDTCSWPAQRRYMSYFECLQHGLVQTDSQPHIILKRIVLVDLAGDRAARVCEVWQQDRKLEHLRFETPEADGAFFQMHTRCKGDISIRVLRASQERPDDGAVVLEVQACFHTAFLQDGFVRFPAFALDSAFGQVPENCALDIYFETDEGTGTPSPKGLPLPAHAPPVSTGHAADAGPQFFDLSDDKDPDTPGGKLVFKPDDIDAFFDDL
mmetsp:Transcript_69690/g.167285  ORF Transcript_69690/g.167285 Transcript_69690/m.167285 type:complete len:386 (-) Transcript_69690:270-1427(-)